MYVTMGTTVEDFKPQIVIASEDIDSTPDLLERSDTTSFVGVCAVYLSSRRGAWILPRVGPNGLPLDVVYLKRWVHLLCRLLPYKFICYVTEKQISERLDHDLYNLKPKHRVWSQHPTVSDVLPIKLLSGTVQIRGPLKHFTRKGVVFDEEQVMFILV
ncbi:UNVERIFIED_CONTAM: Dimethylaniline monooxygenase [N-oxide-forming] 5 [Trichonephila clavipes]